MQAYRRVEGSVPLHRIVIGWKTAVAGWKSLQRYTTLQSFLTGIGMYFLSSKLGVVEWFG